MGDWSGAGSAKSGAAGLVLPNLRAAPPSLPSLPSLAQARRKAVVQRLLTPVALLTQST